MLNLKSCPRCNGDLSVLSDWYGEYENCLQCGWTKDSADDPQSISMKMNLEKLHAELPELTRAS
jgi:hypothetical protein